MTILNQHRPATEWLTDLQRAKLEGITGSKPKITILDMLEKVNDPNAPEMSLIPTSPRSVESCFRLGIDPLELQFHPIVFYKYTGDTDEIAKLRFEKNEQVRQERIKSLIELRKRLVDDGWAGDVGGRGALSGTAGGSPKHGSKSGASATMVEKERVRLEVLKTRQEKELQQMLAYEAQRKELLDKQQKKIDVLDARTREMERQKQEHDKEWLARQREFELQKALEDKELERQAKRMAEERYRREKELQRKAREEEKRIKKEAYQREIERRQKTEEARLETERILAEQAEKVRQRKLAMEAQDAARAKRLAQEAKEMAVANIEKRKKADQRIASALSMNSEILRKRREEFERKEREAEARKAELTVAERKEAELRRQAELAKEGERQHKYMSAVEIEEMRKKAIKDKAEQKERELADLAAQRKRENDIRRVEKEFELKKRLDRVDEISKVNLYQRQSLLERIMDDYERTRYLMRERQDLQVQRKQANMSASLHRHQVAQAMDQLKFTKSLDKLAGPGGNVSINDLLRRPATAR